MRQKTLFRLSDYKSDFGGSLLSGQRKSRRPFTNKNPMKIVLKADSTRSPRLTGFRSAITSMFHSAANQFGVKLYELAICGDHIHFVARFGSSDAYKKFIRALTGTLALRFRVKFKFRPWSRILMWGRSFKIAVAYTLQNHLESTGAIVYQPRKKAKKLRKI